MREHLEDVVCYWDAVADRCLEQFRDELSGKPYDRSVLDAFARRLGADALVCDAGCGPCGHVARLLADRGHVYRAGFTPGELRSLTAHRGFDVEGCDVRAPQPDEIAARRIHVAATRRRHGASSTYAISGSTTSRRRGLSDSPSS